MVSGKRTNMKRIICIFMIGLLAWAVYFFRPLDAYDVFPEFTKATRAEFLVRFHEEKEMEPILAEVTGEKMERFLGLLELPAYRRAFGSTNIHSQSNAYDIVFVHTSGNYSIMINDQGYLIVNRMNNKKKYKILSSSSDTLMKLIEEACLNK